MKPTKKRPAKRRLKDVLGKDSSFWDRVFGKMKRLGTAIEMFKGSEMSIDDPEYFWVNDRIEYYETNGRLLTKEEMKTANSLWKKYGA